MLRPALLASLILFIMPTGAMASDLSEVIGSVDPRATIQSGGSETVVLTSARRLTPHDAPFTEFVNALCDQRAALNGISKVVFLNEFAAQGVEFWTYDDTDDLAGACEKIDGGTAIQMFSVMH